jgi:1,4-dihydroxy-2-naphthoate octaprenyltransferase
LTHQFKLRSCRKVSNEDNKQKLSNDIPPFATLSIVVTIIGLIVALMADAPFQVIAALAALLGALAFYIKRTKN